MLSDDYECEGQLSFDDLIKAQKAEGRKAKKTRNANKPKKAPIWHYSLTRIYTTCPGCGCENTDGAMKVGSTGHDLYFERFGCCKECGQPLDQDEKAIVKASKYSKDFEAANKEWVAARKKVLEDD